MSVEGVNSLLKANKKLLLISGFSHICHKKKGLTGEGRCERQGIGLSVIYAEIILFLQKERIEKS